MADSSRDGAIMSAEEVHLLGQLRVYLEFRNRLVGRDRRDAALVRENRLLIRDCIRKIRRLRDGVAPAWIGLGQRQAR